MTQNATPGTNSGGKPSQRPAAGGQSAEAQHKEAVRRAPQDGPVLNAYGTFLIAQGRYEEAEPLVKRAYGIAPENTQVLNNLGCLLQKRGRMAEAEKFFVQSLRLNPAWPVAHVNLGLLLLETGRNAFAERAFRHAVKMDAKSAADWKSLSQAHQKLNNNAEEMECLQRSLALDPHDESLWVRLIGFLEATSRIEEAEAAVESATAHFPDCPGIVIYEAKLLDRRGKPDDALAAMQKCYDAMQTSAQQNHPFFGAFFAELGKLHDRAGNVDQAFFFFTKKNANRAAYPKARAMDKTLLTKEINYIRDRFTAEQGRTPGAPAMGVEAPVFLVGFPRSGTTLLEQVISSHPGARVSEELPAVDRIAHKIRRQAGQELLDSLSFPASSGPSYPSCLLPVNNAEIESLRQIFFTEHGAAAPGKILVDKHPLNILHAGLIARVFPDAKFILALRHPCDSVLSCFMQWFAINPAMVRFLDLEDAARFYDEAFGLWEHYTKVLNLNVHTIYYEDVVADFQPTVAALLQFLGLEWTDAVLEFDKTAREKGRIKTPSYTQVTQKIYTRASGRWLRYRDHMKSVLPILQPHALKHGYSMEDDVIKAEK
ncbi:MAG: sulfotransferase [Alphaproteobacteria bacterium]